MIRRVSVVAALSIIAFGLSTPSALAEETAYGLGTQSFGGPLADSSEDTAGEDDESEVPDIDSDHTSQGQDVPLDSLRPDSLEDLDSSGDRMEPDQVIADEIQSDHEGLPEDFALLNVSRGGTDFLPQAVAFEANIPGVELITERAEDGSAFVALLVIYEPTAPTEYHFDLAIPEGHTAFMHSDGSIDVTDTAGGYVGSVGSPWAFGADGIDVPTYYTIRDDTLVQVVDHRDATYPVVADPVWLAPLVLAIKVAVKTAVVRCAASHGCRTAVTTAISRGPGLIKRAWNNRDKIRSGDPNSPGRSPANTCNARNRSGC